MKWHEREHRQDMLNGALILGAFLVSALAFVLRFL